MTNNRKPGKITVRWPGHMVHLEVKKVGRIPDGGGRRIHGRDSDQAKTVGRAKSAGAKRGYIYLHSAIDGYSRLSYTEPLLDEKGATAAAFLTRAKAWFAAHGITHIHRVVTDNGACYRSSDFARIVCNQSRHQKTKPYTPRHNGKVERYQRILSEELLYARDFTSEEARSAAIAVWNIHYNYHRPHSGTGGPTAGLTLAGRCHQGPALIHLPTNQLDQPTLPLVVLGFLVILINRRNHILRPPRRHRPSNSVPLLPSLGLLPLPFLGSQPLILGFGLGLFLRPLDFFPVVFPELTHLAGRLLS